MKYILIVGDGMADLPIDALGGKTPLEAIDAPGMARVAAQRRPVAEIEKFDLALLLQRFVNRVDAVKDRFA